METRAPPAPLASRLQGWYAGSVITMGNKVSPLSERAAVLRLNHDDLVARSGLSIRTIYNLFDYGTTGLSVNAAERLSRPLRVHFLTLLVSHSLWRKSTGHKLLSSERAWIETAEKITGHSADALAKADLVTLDDALNRPPPAPSVLLKKESKK